MRSSSCEARLARRGGAKLVQHEKLYRDMLVLLEAAEWSELSCEATTSKAKRRRTAHSSALLELLPYSHLSSSIMSTPPREDLPATLGTHCAACNSLDFLPIRCTHCSLIFCRHHSSPPAHSCTKDPNNRIVSEGSRFAGKFNDLLPDPNRLVGERAATEKAREGKTEAARKVLERNFGKEAVAKLGARPASGNAAGSAPKKAKVSPVIALMKLKQRAKPVDAKSKDVSMDDRLYLTVELLEGEDRVKKSEKELFLAKVSSGPRHEAVPCLSFLLRRQLPQAELWTNSLPSLGSPIRTIPRLTRARRVRLDRTRPIRVRLTCIPYSFLSSPLHQNHLYG